MVQGAHARDSHTVRGAAEYCMVYRDRAPEYHYHAQRTPSVL